MAGVAKVAGHLRLIHGAWTFSDVIGTSTASRSPFLNRRRSPSRTSLMSRPGRRWLIQDRGPADHAAPRMPTNSIFLVRPEPAADRVAGLGGDRLAGLVSELLEPLH